MNSSHRAHTGESRGFTIMEVIVAAVILGITVVTAGRLLVGADRIRGRASQIAAAVQLSQNDAARMRSAAQRLEPINDTDYVVYRNGLELRLRRTVIPPPVVPPVGELRAAQVQIDVSTAGQETSFLSVRLLQGYDR